jgi:hypothetical protein
MYGLNEHRSYRINIRRRYSGRALLLLSVLLVGQPFGFEKGFFYWLFALMAIALCFVQLRVWQPKAILIITSLSLTGLMFQLWT